MKLSLIQTKVLLASILMFVISSKASQAALLGTELSLETVFQQTSGSAVDTIGFLTTATVKEPSVEFPSLEALEVPGAVLVDVAINVGDEFLEIDFDNVTLSSFTPAFMNGYVFTFGSSVAVDFTSASIDTSVTTLGLSQSDVTFSGNRLTVNVEGLPFDTSTFARINLTSVGGSTPVVPLPASVWLFTSGVVGLLGLMRRRVLLKNT